MRIRSLAYVQAHDKRESVSSSAERTKLSERVEIDSSTVAPAVVSADSNGVLVLWSAKDLLKGDAVPVCELTAAKGTRITAIAAFPSQSVTSLVRENTTKSEETSSIAVGSKRPRDTEKTGSGKKQQLAPTTGTKPSPAKLVPGAKPKKSVQLKSTSNKKHRPTSQSRRA